MRILVAVLAARHLAGCGTGTPTSADPPAPTPSSPAPTETSTAGTRHTRTGVEQPPPFRVRYDGHELALRPHTYCYGNGCVDGIVERPPSIGSPGEIEVFVPIDRFELSVHAREPGCGGRGFEVTVEDLGEGWYAVRAFGPASRYDVQLFAQNGGDMVGALRWRTPADGVMPEPSARLALIAEHDGEPDSYGLELAVDDLAATPEAATAEIEVTAGNGRTMTIRAEQAHDRCRSAGDLYFDRPDGPAKEAAGLGDLPFTTTVTLTLDGREYLATAVYPDDEIEGDEPSVALDFTPALPGL